MVSWKSRTLEEVWVEARPSQAERPKPLPVSPRAENKCEYAKNVNQQEYKLADVFCEFNKIALGGNIDTAG